MNLVYGQHEYCKLSIKKTFCKKKVLKNIYVDKLYLCALCGL